MFILNWIYICYDGTHISNGYFAGANKKYSDMFNLVPFKEYAYKFDNETDAIIMRQRLNKNGYNFIVEKV